MPSPEPKYTCPIVDKHKDRVKDLQEDLLRVLENIENCPAWNLGDKIQEAEKEIKELIWQLSDEIEEVRASNIDLRDWGREWVSRSNFLDEQLQEKEDYITDLNEQLQEKEDYITDLNEQLSKVCVSK